MNPDTLKGKKIGVLGFGQEGQAVARYLSELQITFAIFDSAEKAKWTEASQDLATTIGAEVFLFNSSDENSKRQLLSQEILFRSPGIPRLHPLILEAEQAGVTITSQAKYFFENFTGQIIGVTGTKGKGTTSSLIYEMLQKGFAEDANSTTNKRRLFLTGNIGKIQPLEFLNQSTADDIAVYEMSSFQLQDLGHSPQTAVVLMVTEDHLDHHKNLDEYHSAKSSITKFQSAKDIAIYNQDYLVSNQIGKLSPGRHYQVSEQLPKLDSGAVINGNQIKIYDGGQIADEFDFSQRLLKGQHNMQNIAAALLAVKQFGFHRNILVRAINEFKGLEHRLEFVTEINGITFINDSIATLPEPTMAAIKAFDQPKILLLGGSRKGLNYAQLVQFIKEREDIKAISFLGETGHELQGLLKNSDNFIDLGHATSLGEAFKQIKGVAEKGDCVLLSPASASFDMFNSYRERGNAFKEMASNWKDL